MMHLMLSLTEYQYNFVMALSRKTGQDPSDLVYEALTLGWPALDRKYNPPAVPPPPPLPKQVVRELWGPINKPHLRLVK